MSTVFIADDYKLSEVLDAVADGLKQRGVDVIRGPKTERGVRLKYKDEDLQRLFGDADVAMFSSRSICDSRVINAAPKLRGIVNPTIAVDTVDVKLATEKGILVGNGAIPENYLQMAEAAVMLILMLLYQPKRSEALLKVNAPEPGIYEHWAKMLYGCTVGFVGCGRIGRAVAERLQNWNIRMITPKRNFRTPVPEMIEIVDPDEFYASCDVIGIYATVTDETRNMFNDELFAKMKDGVKIVNVARGQIIDEDALCRALESGKVAGAALDTFQTEPLPMDSHLRDFDNLILTPHIVGHSLESQLKFIPTAIENVMSIIEGKLPPYCVNPEAFSEFERRFL